MSLTKQELVKFICENASRECLVDFLSYVNRMEEAQAANALLACVQLQSLWEGVDEVP